VKIVLVNLIVFILWAVG
jgi:hypothetical protein